MTVKRPHCSFATNKIDTLTEKELQTLMSHTHSKTTKPYFDVAKPIQPSFDALSVPDDTQG